MEYGKSAIQQLILCGIALCSVYSGKAQQTFYCKERLPDIVNSYTRTLLPVLHPSGTRLYFVRKEHPGNIGGISDPDDIWFSDRINGNYWTEPSNAGPTINTIRSNALFSITADGNSAFMATVNAFGGLTFHMASLNNDVWSIGPAFDIHEFSMVSSQYFATMNADQNVLILAMNQQGSLGDLDMFVSFKQKDQTWTTPIWMGNTINTGSREGSPFIARDNKTLYYYSSGLGGYGGSDLYMTRRLDDTWKAWTKPINLGPYINTKGNERSITLTSRGDTACIISTDTINDQEGMYFVCLQPELRPQDKIPVIIPQSQQQTQSDIQLEIYFNNNEWSLSTKHQETLEQLCNQVKDKNKYLIIRGYTDDKGSFLYNKKLSRRRAQSVVDYLKTCGLISFEMIGEGIRTIEESLELDERRARSRAVSIYMTIQQ